MLNAKILAAIVVTPLMFVIGCEASHTTSPSSAPATQSAAKPVASDPIPDLPDYPGATRTEYTTGKDVAQGFTRVTKVVFVTSDPDDKVNGFYAKSLKDNGWKMSDVTSSVESVAEAKERMVFNASKAAGIAKIEIDQKGKGNVVITVERKDR